MSNKKKILIIQNIHEAGIKLLEDNRNFEFELIGKDLVYYSNIGHTDLLEYDSTKNSGNPNKSSSLGSL